MSVALQKEGMTLTGKKRRNKFQRGPIRVDGSRDVTKGKGLRQVVIRATEPSEGVSRTARSGPIREKNSGSLAGSP